MTRLSLEDFDRHIDSLRAQLSFLNETLESTDYNAPDWLASDLISLRNRSGRLHEDMKRFRDQIESEGVAEKKTKTSNKRLSLEAKRPSTPTPKVEIPVSQTTVVSPPIEQSPTPRAKPEDVNDTYVVQHVDVTEEVNRRLRESRLRRLMETPRTAQKRKYNAEDALPSDAAEGGDEVPSGGAYSGSEYERTPTKRIKSSGTFEQVGKRKDNTEDEQRGPDQFADRVDNKRRKV